MFGYGAKLTAARSTNAESPSVVGKQAIIFGGTSGIGKALAMRLAREGASVTIAGRNSTAGAKIVELMNGSSLNTTAVHNYLKVDVSSMENAKNAVNHFISSLEAVAAGDSPATAMEAPAAIRLDYLVFCQTKATLQGRTPTKDGIDEKLALNYYSRVYLTNLLAPLMEETAKRFEGADPRVMSVLSAGAHKPYPHFKEDPYLVDHYSQSAAANITSFYSDLWVDKASQLWPSVTFVHIAPGFVGTNWGTDMPFLLRGLIRGLQATVAKSASDCAEFLLPALTSPKLKGGFRLLGEYSNAVPKTNLHTAEAVEQVHKDTNSLLEAAFLAK